MKKPSAIYAVILLQIFLPVFLSCGNSSYSPGKPVNSGPAIGGFDSSDYGYAVYDIENSALVMDHNINSAFIPASVTKLMTSVFALETLGKGYRFSTDILHTGSIEEGIIRGDLYIKGSGDPELSAYSLSLMAAGMRSKKIRGLTGGFYYDESIMPGEDHLDPGMSDCATYNSGIGAINLNKNAINLVRRSGSDGSFTYEFVPSVPSITFVTYDEKPVFPFVSYSFTSGREIWKVPSVKVLSSRHTLPVKKTALFTAWNFYNMCMINGIKLNEPRPGKTPDNAELLYRHRSRPLQEIIPDMLQESDNLTAEVLGRAALSKYRGADFSLSFTDAASEFFRHEFPLVGWEGFIINNASGLSSASRITPEETVTVLISLYHNYGIENMLSMSGESGTLRNRLEEPGTIYRVYGKTGTIFYASALAGLVYGSSGRRYIFAVFINDRKRRSHIDSKASKGLNDSIEAGRWTKRATDAIDKFVEGIISIL